jgi:hypothetical protein
MVVVEKITKVSYFISVNSAHKAFNIAKIHMQEVAKFHGVPKTIVFDRDSKFTFNFCKGLFKGFGTNLNFNTTYHPETNGKT